MPIGSIKAGTEEHGKKGRETRPGKLCERGLSQPREALSPAPTRHYQAKFLLSPLLKPVTSRPFHTTVIRSPVATGQAACPLCQLVASTQWDNMQRHERCLAHV